MTAYRDLESEHLEAQARLKENLEAMKSDFAATFGTPHGARVLAHLVDWAKVFGTTYVFGDSHASAFNEGVRNGILYCLTMSGRLNLPTER